MTMEMVCGQRYLGANLPGLGDRVDGEIGSDGNQMCVCGVNRPGKMLVLYLGRLGNI